MTRPQPLNDLAMAPDLLALRTIGPWLQDLLAGLGPAAVELQSRLELAVHEVCVNIVEHADLPAGAQIHLDGRLDPAGAVVVITDHGRDFHPEDVAVPDPAVPQIRGYGLMIARQLVDDLHYERDRSTNRWTLRIDSSTGSATEGETR